MLAIVSVSTFTVSAQGGSCKACNCQFVNLEAVASLGSLCTGVHAYCYAGGCILKA